MKRNDSASRRLGVNERLGVSHRTALGDGYVRDPRQMNRFTKLVLTLVVLGGTMQMSAQRVSFTQQARPQQQGRMVVPSNLVMPMATTLSAISAVPATISFSLTDPTTTPSVAGNSTATVSWTTSGGAAALVPGL